MTSRANADLYAGLLIASIGGLGLWLSLGQSLGSLFRMGPGYMPMLLSGLLLLLGGIIALRGLVRPDSPVRLGSLRPPLLIAGSVLAFAFCIRNLGLVPAVLAAVLVASPALPGEGRRRWIEILLLAALMALFSVAVFIWGLGLTLPAFTWGFGR